MADQPKLPPMTLALDEAIKEMLAGRVMVDARGAFHRCTQVSGFKPDVAVVIPRRFDGTDWRAVSNFYGTGWRHATPEELREIERCSR